ncbi:MAG: amylo-alpha-1,6-glucosidase [Bacteroidales bacterium]|nr:amylo-alpha-1,6-glucosidase [Bacteroidales bacterium]
MSYIEFDKSRLINLEYSLKREFIRSNRAGAYACSTIINCNTRKYHGLLICPIDNLDTENHVLLSALDETIIQRDKEFHLAVRRYPGGVFHPGHKYLRDFSSEPIPTLTYRVGGVILKKEMLLAEESALVLIKYTLIDAHSPTKIRLHPFLAFRQVHCLSKANMDVNLKYENAENGIKTRMYNAYPYLYMQISKKNEYIHAPDWYYNIEYLEEEKRGYEFSEDLFVPGYFEFSIKKGESVVFAASLKERKPVTLKRRFTAEIKKRIPRNNFENCLINSAHQFIVRRKGKTEIIAGFPWFGTWGRDTFIALPGLTLAIGDTKTAKDVLDTMTGQLHRGLFKNMGSHDNADLNSVDAPLWYFWAIQQYVQKTKNYKLVWRDYGNALKSILENYKKGTKYNIKLHDNYLIWAGQEGKALTWMDAVVNNVPVTPRIGYDVEIQALWYNAVMFALELAEKNKDKEFIEQWKDIPPKIKKSFLETFWIESKKHLFDYVDEQFADKAVRPNQVFAVSLPYSMLNIDQMKGVVDRVTSELLTPRGLRSLSPKNKNYKGIYEGDQATRDSAYHQGTVWPWLTGHFAEAYLRVYEKSGLYFIEKLYRGFEEEMNIAGIGSISEIYDGNPPHEARGAISQAWSVAELLRTKTLIDEYKNDA